MSCADDCELTPRMVSALRLLHAYTKGIHRERLTPNEIGSRLGFRHGHKSQHASSHNGRTMGPATRVTFSLTALRSRGLVSMGSRPDGLSGTAYSITDAGELWCTEHPE